MHAEAQAFSAGAFPPMGSHIEAGNGFGNGLLDLSAGGAAGSAAGGAPDMGGAAGRAPAGAPGGAPGGAPDMGGAPGRAPGGAPGGSGGAPDMGGATGRAPAGAPGGAPDMGGAPGRAPGRAPAGAPGGSGGAPGAAGRAPAGAPGGAPGGAPDMGGAPAGAPGRAPAGAADMGGAPGRAPAGAPDMGGAGGAPGGAPDMGGAPGRAPAGAADMGGAPPLVLALFAKVLQVVPLTLVWVLWEQLGLVFLLDLSVWKQLVPRLQVVLHAPLVVLQVVPLDEVASGEVALFLKVPPTLVWVLWVLWEQLVQGQGLLLLVQGEGLLFQLKLLVLLVHMERGSWEQGSWGGWEQLGQLGQVGLLLPSWHIGKGLGPPLPALQQCSLQRRPLLPSPWPTAGASPGYWHPQWSPIAGPPIPAKPTAGGFAPAHGRLTEPSLLCCASAPWLCCASGVRSKLKSVYALKSELIGVMLIDDCCLSLRSIMWSGVKADSAYCLSLTPAQFPAGGGEMWHSKGAMI